MQIHFRQCGWKLDDRPISMKLHDESRTGSFHRTARIENATHHPQTRETIVSTAASNPSSFGPVAWYVKVLRRALEALLREEAATRR